jgi:hypothetical protein
MFRGCVSLLVLVGFIASQLAVMPHAHGAASAEEQRNHDATPHFHWNSLSHSHSHSGHNHAHPHHTSAKPRSKTSVDSTSDDSTTRLAGADQYYAEHDADAIFVNAHAVYGSGSPDRAASVSQVAILALPCVGSATSPIATPTLRWHPPDIVLDASDSYLTLRNLRI